MTIYKSAMEEFFENRHKYPVHTSLLGASDMGIKLYHGTTIENAKNIIKSGKLIPHLMTNGHEELYFTTNLGTAFSYGSARRSFTLDEAVRAMFKLKMCNLYIDAGDLEKAEECYNYLAPNKNYVAFEMDLSKYDVYCRYWPPTPDDSIKYRRYKECSTEYVTRESVDISNIKTIYYCTVQRNASTPSTKKITVEELLKL